MGLPVRNDDELILSCRHDPVAFGALIQRFQARVYGFLIRLSGRDGADDLFQEVWLKVYEGSVRYQPRGKAASWIFTIAHNTATDAARCRRLGPLDEGEAGLDIFAFKGPGPAAAFESAERNGRIEAAIARLPAEQRAVFLMRKQGEMSFKEISAVLGIPLGTALSRMNAALQKLRDALEEEQRAS